jgi:hypothetical protein
VTEATQPWFGFKYAPVRGLTDRRIARYLRTQRKNMRRFFAERGLFDELDQMERIRKSRQGTTAKNEMFREVLDAYAARTTAQSGAEAPPANHTEERPTASAAVEVQPAGESADGERGPRPDAGNGVQGLAAPDGSEHVIEE